MNKICTSKEQSKKLIELGMDIKTADMCWSIDISDLPTLLAYPITDCDNWENKIPAWSLSALLELMPITCVLSISNGHYRIVSNETNTFFHNNPLDAAFEMIVWLKENEKI